MDKPTKYPKFLRCNDEVKGWSWNKYLPKPWMVGEVVKVADESEQHSSCYVGTPDDKFREKYVVVYRKDDKGKFTVRNTAEWRQLTPLNK